MSHTMNSVGPYVTICHSRWWFAEDQQPSARWWSSGEFTFSWCMELSHAAWRWHVLCVWSKHKDRNQTAWQMLSSLLSNWRRISSWPTGTYFIQPNIVEDLRDFFLLSVCFCDSVPRLSSVSFQTALCVAAWGFYRTYRQLGLYPPVPWNVSRAKLWQRSCAELQKFIGAVTKEPRKGRIQQEVSAFEFVCAPWHAPQ